MDPRLLRIVYLVEFLIALVAVYTLWSQVGGQSHLDLIEWHWKLVLGVGLSLAVVLATASAFDAEKALNRASVAWSFIALILMLAMGSLTYYHHLHEQDEADQGSDAEIEQTHRL